MPYHNSPADSTVVDHRQWQPVLFYQPQYQLDSGSVHCLEAQLQEIDGDTMVASTRLRLAERDGSIHILGQRIIARALWDFSSLRRHYPELQRIAVKVSPIQLQHSDFVKQLQQTLTASPVAAERLQLALTEKFPLAHCQALVDNIIAVNQLGSGVLLDDFGSGYTSLPLLAQLPIQGVKLDSLFSDNLTLPRFCNITRSLLALCKKLDIPSLMSGIQSEQQLQQVKTLGCQWAQGNFLHTAHEA